MKKRNYQNYIKPTLFFDYYYRAIITGDNIYYLLYVIKECQ